MLKVTSSVRCPGFFIGKWWFVAVLVILQDNDSDFHCSDFIQYNNWNNLTNNIVLSDNINQFKTRLERFWSEKESKFDPTGYHGLIL